MKIILLFILSFTTTVGAQNLKLTQLGEKLFFDPLLSGQNTMSCASCHNPQTGWSDLNRTAIGENGTVGNRRTQSLIDVAQNTEYFWDGRALSLEEQALGPIQSPAEMNQNLDELLLELKNQPHYVESFKHLFQSEVKIEFVAKALAAFERTINHPYSAFEKWFYQKDEGAISEDAKKGFQLFRSPKARCHSCHLGMSLSDGQFWDIGLDTTDVGRGPIEPNNEWAQFGFRTPILWGVSTHPPFFHNGSAKTLLDVVEHYNKGGVTDRDSIHPNIRPLGLTIQEKKQLVDFLKTL